MTPSRTRRRLLALPAIGLAALLTVPVAAGADSGRGGGSKSEVSTTETPTTTTAVTPSESSTTSAPTTVAPTSVAPTSISPTSSVPGRNKDVLKFLSDLTTMLEKAKISDDVRNAVLPRVRAMRDAVAAGALPTQIDLQSLSAEVLAAVGRPSGRGTSTTAAVAPSTSSAMPPTSPPTTPPVAPSSSSPRSASSGGKQFDLAKVSSQLDEWVKKVNASSLSDADKAALLSSIEALRSLSTAGTLKAVDLTTLKAVVGAALERAPGQEDVGSDESSTSSSTPSSTSTGEAPEAGGSDDPGRRPGGKLAVDAAITAVTNSPLPEGVKQNILGVLTQAKSILDDASLTPEQASEQLRRLCDAEKAQRLTEAAAKLVTFSQKIAVLAFDAGSLPGAGDVIVAVHDKLAQANELLAAPTLDIATVKSAWKLLHEARTLMQRFLESSTSTSTSTPDPITTPDTSAPTTVAEGAAVS